MVYAVSVMAERKGSVTYIEEVLLSTQMYTIIIYVIVCSNIKRGVARIRSRSEIDFERIFYCALYVVARFQRIASCHGDAMPYESIADGSGAG